MCWQMCRHTVRSRRSTAAGTVRIHNTATEQLWILAKFIRQLSHCSGHAESDTPIRVRCTCIACECGKLFCRVNQCIGQNRSLMHQQQSSFGTCECNYACDSTVNMLFHSINWNRWQSELLGLETGTKIAFLQVFIWFGVARASVLSDDRRS